MDSKHGPGNQGRLPGPLEFNARIRRQDMLPENGEAAGDDQGDEGILAHGLLQRLGLAGPG